MDETKKKSPESDDFDFLSLPDDCFTFTEFSLPNRVLQSLPDTLTNNRDLCEKLITSLSNLQTNYRLNFPVKIPTVDVLSIAQTLMKANESQNQKQQTYSFFAENHLPFYRLFLENLAQVGDKNRALLFIQKLFDNHREITLNLWMSQCLSDQVIGIYMRKTHLKTLLDAVSIPNTIKLQKEMILKKPPQLEHIFFLSVCIATQIFVNEQGNCFFLDDENVKKLFHHYKIFFDYFNGQWIDALFGESDEIPTDDVLRTNLRDELQFLEELYAAVQIQQCIFEGELSALILASKKQYLSWLMQPQTVEFLLKALNIIPNIYESSTLEEVMASCSSYLEPVDLEILIKIYDSFHLEKNPYQIQAEIINELQPLLLNKGISSRLMLSIFNEQRSLLPTNRSLCMEEEFTRFSFIRQIAALLMIDKVVSLQDVTNQDDFSIFMQSLMAGEQNDYKIIYHLLTQGVMSPFEVTHQLSHHPALIELTKDLCYFEEKKILLSLNQNEGNCFYFTPQTFLELYVDWFNLRQNNCSRKTASMRDESINLLEQSYEQLKKIKQAYVSYSRKQPKLYHLWEDIRKFYLIASTGIAYDQQGGLRSQQEFIESLKSLKGFYSHLESHGNLVPSKIRKAFEQLVSLMKAYQILSEEKIGLELDETMQGAENLENLLYERQKFIRNHTKPTKRAIQESSDSKEEARENIQINL